MDDCIRYNIPAKCYCMPRNWSQIRIGRSAGEDIIIMDDHVSGAHVLIEMSGDRRMVIITVLGRNGASINGIYYKSGSKVIEPVGVRLEICSFWICVGIFHCFMVYKGGELYRTGLMEVKPSLAGRSINESNGASIGINGGFTPTIRCAPAYNLEPIELDSPPARKNPEKQPVLLVAGPALTMAVPILLGSGRKIMLIAGVISAIWASANVLSRRKKVKTEERKRRKAYVEYVSICEGSIQERTKEIKNTMLAAYPGLDEYLKGGGNIHLIWNREKTHEDFWFLRCGIGEKNFPVEIKYQREKFTVTEDSLKYLPGELNRKYAIMTGVPVGVNLAEKRLFGISTESVKKSWEVAFSLTLMIAVNIRYEDVKIAYFPDNPAGLLSVAYLPHNWDEGHSLLALPGEEVEVISRIKRTDMDICLFTDRIDIVSEMLNCSNVRVFYIAESFEQIPAYVDCIFHVAPSFSGIIDCSGVLQNRIKMIFDRVSLQKFDQFSRGISALSSHVCDIKTPIPDKVLLMDLLMRTIIKDYRELNADAVRACWNMENEEDSLAVPLGETYDNRIIWLDIDEFQAGPHGLIAGTTGSGKSELLQTFILSLAVRFSPEDVNFFLIDYKGGGMANMFSKMPHLSGSISNLSGAVIERAMVSIKSEIRYRQTKFNETGVNNIRDYRRVAKMPHILIIIDEFAELKKEEPEFMSQLVSVAQVGRSLGVHLILSTQKPSGVVDDKIWSNARFRICLKVRDKMDSNDMLHRSDAAYITNVGRAYIQVGNDEVFEEFQCGYTSAPVSKRHGDSTMRLYDSRMCRVRLNEIADKTEVLTESLTDDSGNLDENRDIYGQETFALKERTQIDFIQEIIIKTFETGSYNPVRKLWLDELGALVLPKDENSCAIGIYDDPVNQYQGECEFDLMGNGNTAILGMSASGKSVLIMRILAGLVSKYDADVLNLYILDYGGKRLEPFGKSNLCGGYIGIEECDRTSKMLRFIGEQIKVRQQQKNHNHPHILVVIDNYAGMLEYAGENLGMDITEMLRNGKSQQVTFLISAGNIGGGELSNRAMPFIDTVIPLSLKDKYTYAASLNVAASGIPAIDQTPGRGMIKIDKRVLTFQGYVPVRNHQENQWETTITKVIENRNDDNPARAPGYPYIPPNPTVKELSEIIALYDTGSCTVERWKDDLQEIPIGYAEETGKIYCLPYHKISVLLLVGRLRSGRKNALNVICQMASKINISVYKIEHISELSELIQTQTEGIAAIDDIGLLLGEFYKNEYDPETEKTILDYLDMGNMYPEETSLKICAVSGSKDKSVLCGRKLWTSLCEHPFGICMGGSLDEQSMFDYSYMGYGAMSKRRRAGWGSVAFYEEEIYYGHIIVPLCEKE